MKRIRTLIADDSPTMRAALSRLLAEDPLIEVVGVATDGAEAVAQARALRPDVITMDVKMPRLDGLEATAAIMSTVPARILIVSAVHEDAQQDLSFRAIAAGALEVIAKPTGDAGFDLRAWGRRVAESVRLMAEVPVVTRRRLGLVMPMPPVAGDALDRPARVRVAGPGVVDAFAIVSSTGGPPALAAILGALPATLPIPIFLAQHMAFGFVPGLQRWLASVTPLAVTLAEHGTIARPGHAYLPPDGHDLTLGPGGYLETTPNPGGHCPSGDRLLNSLARSYGARAGGVVLTGMGDDGAQGLLAMRRAGAATFGQDEASCVVYGMPRVAFAVGAVQAQVGVEQVAAIIQDLCRNRS